MSEEENMNGGEGFGEESTPAHEEASAKPAAEPNFEILTSPIKDISDKRPASIDDLDRNYLSIAADNVRALEKFQENYPSFDEVDSIWYRAYATGLTHTPRGGSLQDALSRSDALWRQKLNVDGADIGVSMPRFGGGKDGVISGDQAVMKAANLLGTGNTIQVPLHHTGIWVTICPPAEADYLGLEQRLVSDKVELGRAVRGMLYSNMKVYTHHHILNMVFRHVRDSTLKNTNAESLRRIIKSQDIPILLWGLARTTYPSGYNFARACASSPSICSHVETGKIDLGKMFFVDNNALTPWQKRFMADRSAKRTIEEIREYQEQHERGQPRTFEIQNGITVRLSVPTIQGYESAGFAWVDSVVQTVEEQMSVDATRQEMNNNISEQARVSSLRQYAHWIDRVNLSEDEVIEDRDTIDRLLGQLSGDDEIFTKILNEIGKFIDDSTISLIAMSKHKCRMCGEEQEGDYYRSNFTELMPIDVVSAFFTLLDQRVSRLLIERES